MATSSRASLIKIKMSFLWWQLAHCLAHFVTTLHEMLQNLNWRWLVKRWMVHLAFMEHFLLVSYQACPSYCLLLAYWGKPVVLIHPWTCNMSSASCCVCYPLIRAIGSRCSLMIFNVREILQCMHMFNFGLSYISYFLSFHYHYIGADPISSLLIEGLISMNEVNKSVFFTCSFRDNETNKNEAFNQWLRSMSTQSLQTIKLDNLNMSGVNQLLSETLHCSPRITRPLAYTLHHKSAGGNPFYLVQLSICWRRRISSTLIWAVHVGLGT